MNEKELRELDAEVAVEVMGYVYVNGRDDGDGDKYTLLMLPEEAAEWCKRFPYCRIEKEPWATVHRDGGYCLEDMFPVSIAAAWEVVEKMRASNLWLTLSLDAYGYNAGFVMRNMRPNWTEWTEWGITTPALAICRAALAAVKSRMQASGS